MADHWGKIACHFPARGNPNSDVWDIEFRPKGGNANVKIDRVYMIPPGADVSTVPKLQNYIVWTTDVKLEAESDTVCIEYVPNVDISLSNVAVFSVDNKTTSTINFAIFHESGLVVAKSNNGSKTAMEKFGLSGNRWLASVSGVTLKKGFKYYIQFTNENEQEKIKAVAMDGWYGNYKIFSHGNAQNKSIANLNSAHEWLGVIDSSMGIFNMKAGDFFLWQTSGWTPGLSNGHIYMRSSAGQGLTFSGIIGDPSSYSHIIEKADLQNLIGKPNGSAFIWYIHSYPNMANGSIWQKNFDSDNIDLLDFTQYSSNEFAKTAAVLTELQTEHAVVGEDGTFWYSGSTIGSVYTLKSGFRNRVESTTALTAVPDNLQDGDIFYMAPNNYDVPWSTGQVWLDGVYVYSSQYSNYVKQVQQNTSDAGHIPYTDVFDVAGINSLLLYVCEYSDLTSADWDSNYQSDGLRTSTLYTDQKHYLEINGTEV